MSAMERLTSPHLLLLGFRLFPCLADFVLTKCLEILTVYAKGDKQDPTSCDEMDLHFSAPTDAIVHQRRLRA
ncbi:hypothetical protein C8R46DRAFT_640807 [Mycena filopes]|nr:hypothetical protein C8R46DRAFT_640807 [Mycena filopes]